MQHRGRAWGVVSMILALAGVLGTPAASAQPRARTAAAPLVFPSQFQLRSSLYGIRVVANDRYAVSDAIGVGAVITDDLTGRRALVPPFCGWGAETVYMLPPVLGGRWLATDLPGCTKGLPRDDHRVGLYDIARHRWSSVVVGPRDDTFCIEHGYTPGCGSVSVFEVGARWIGLRTGCNACTTPYSFHNIRSGRVRILRDWTAGGRTVPNLNSPTLASKICAPLRLPASNVDLSPFGGAGDSARQSGVASAPWNPHAGETQFFGRLAVASSWTESGLHDLDLEHCGSRLHMRLASGPLLIAATNRHLAIWTTATALQGIFFPSLRRFTIPLPSALSQPEQLQATSHMLYVVEGPNLWTMPAPRPPIR